MIKYSRLFFIVIFMMSVFVGAPQLVPSFDMPTAAAQGSPSNDDLANARVIGSLPFTDTVDTTSATVETNEVGGCSPGSLNTTVWWQYTPTGNREVLINTNGSNYDTQLYVFTGTAHPLTCVAFDDDSGPGAQSRLQLILTGGTTYYIAIDGFGNSAGNAVLNITTVLPVLTLSAPTVNEGAGSISISVTVTGVVADQYFFEFTTTSDTATVNVDFSNVNVSSFGGFATGFLGNVNINIYQDDIAEGTEQFLMVFSTLTNITANPSPAVITILDDDTVGVTVSPTSGLATDENGTTDTFTVVLDSEPLGDVYIDVTSLNADEATTDQAQLHFDAGNWDSAQTVTVTGEDDFIADGTQSFTIELTMNGSTTDTFYAGINPDDVTGSNGDNETVGLNVSPLSLSLGEDEQPAFEPNAFSVSLLNAPNAGETVTVNLTYDASQMTVSSNSLTFNSSNFNVPQVVTVNAINDGIEEVNGAFVIDLISSSSFGSGAPYDGLSKSVNVLIFDYGANIIGHIPNYGVILIPNTAPVKAAGSPSEGVAQHRDGSDIYLPADYDGNGFDTYVVTDIRNYNGNTWLSLWIGNMNWLWVEWNPATMSEIQQIEWDKASDWTP